MKNVNETITEGRTNVSNSVAEFTEQAVEVLGGVAEGIQEETAKELDADKTKNRSTSKSEHRDDDGGISSEVLTEKQQQTMSSQVKGPDGGPAFFLDVFVEPTDANASGNKAPSTSHRSSRPTSDDKDT